MEQDVDDRLMWYFSKPGMMTVLRAEALCHDTIIRRSSFIRQQRWTDLRDSNLHLEETRSLVHNISR